MGLVTKPYTFTAGTTIVSTQVNSDFDTLYSLVNGLLDNANIAGAANIDWAKLATTISRNLSFATTYGIATDFTLANNFIVQFNQTLPAPMSVTARTLRAYNTSFSAGAWVGRTTTNACYAIIESTINTIEIYFAPSASAGVAPVWTEMYKIDISTGHITTGIVDLVTSLGISQYRMDEWAVRQAALYPPNWALISGAATTSVVIGNRNAQRMGAATLLQSSDMFRVAGGETVRLAFRISYSGAGVPTAKTFGFYKPTVGSWVYMGFTSGVANQVVCATADDAGVANVQQVAFTYAADTWYDCLIELDSTSARFYMGAAGNKLTLLLAQTANLPSVTDLVPYIFENGAQNIQLNRSWVGI